MKDIRLYEKASNFFYGYSSAPLGSFVLVDLNSKHTYDAIAQLGEKQIVDIILELYWAILLTNPIHGTHIVLSTWRNWVVESVKGLVFSA